MAYKAINEKFPPEVWEEINSIKTDCNMTWQEFLPYAAKCSKYMQISLDNLERIDLKFKYKSMDETLSVLLDCWDERQRERDDIE